MPLATLATDPIWYAWFEGYPLTNSAFIHLFSRRDNDP